MNYFVSHSSRDKKIVDEFTSHILITGLGVDRNSLFYSSRKSTGIPLGENIYKVLRDKLRATQIFVPIFSKDYLESKICMSEIGGAWLNEISVLPLIIPPLQFRDLRNVIEFEHIIAENINDSAGLDNFKDCHDKTIHSSATNTSDWNYAKEKFLNSIKSAIKYDDLSSSRGKHLRFHGAIEDKDIKRTLERIEKLSSVRSSMVCSNDHGENREIEVEFENEIDRLTIDELLDQEIGLPNEIRDTLRLV